MAVQSQGTVAMKLENRISVIKYCLFCFSIILCVIGALMFVLSIMAKVDEPVQNYVDNLKMGEYYIGLYMLIVISFFVVVFSAVACAVAMWEHHVGLVANAAIQSFTFLSTITSSAVLMSFSNINSSIEPIIRDGMLYLIDNSQRESVASILKSVQEGAQCCGAYGPNDYLRYSKPLPSDCRDSRTGNAFFYNCVEKITWYLEAHANWLMITAAGVCIMNVLIAVLSLILLAALKKENKISSPRR